MGTKTLIIGCWGVEGEECAEWGGFGSQGIGIVLCDRAWASHQVLGWSAGTRFCCHDSRVFAAGDVQDKKYRQVVTSASTGLWTSSISPLHYLYFDFGTSMFAPLLVFILFGIMCFVWGIRCICFCGSFLLLWCQNLFKKCPWISVFFCLLQWKYMYKVFLMQKLYLILFFK